MKVKVIQGYHDTHGGKQFKVGDIIDVTVNPNSDWYHIWDKTNLYIIPKEYCKEVKK